jgi:hypothetical protein
MCLSRAPVPHRLPHPRSAANRRIPGPGVHVERGGDVSGSAAPWPVEVPSRDPRLVERHSLCRYRVADHGDELWITPGTELPIGAVTVTTLWAAGRTDFLGIRWQADPAPQARTTSEDVGSITPIKPPAQPSVQRSFAAKPR